MANEITLVGSLTYTDPITMTNILLALPPQLQKTIGTRLYSAGIMSVPTTAGGTVIPLGSVTALGYFALINRDLNNFVNMLTATSGTIIHTLDSNYGFVVGKFGSGITAPALIANTTACEVEYLILNA